MEALNHDLILFFLRRPLQSLVLPTHTLFDDLIKVVMDQCLNRFRLIDLLIDRVQTIFDQDSFIDCFVLLYLLEFAD